MGIQKRSHATYRNDKLTATVVVAVGRKDYSKSKKSAEGDIRRI